MQERGGKHFSPSNIFKIIDRKKTLVYENRVPSVFSFKEVKENRQRARP